MRGDEERGKPTDNLVSQSKTMTSPGTRGVGGQKGTGSSFIPSGRGWAVATEEDEEEAWGSVVVVVAAAVVAAAAAAFAAVSAASAAGAGVPGLTAAWSDLGRKELAEVGTEEGTGTLMGCSTKPMSSKEWPMLAGKGMRGWFQSQFSANVLILFQW